MLCVKENVRMRPCKREKGIGMAECQPTLRFSRMRGVGLVRHQWLGVENFNSVDQQPGPSRRSSHKYRDLMDWKTHGTRVAPNSGWDHPSSRRALPSWRHWRRYELASWVTVSPGRTGRIVDPVPNQTLHRCYLNQQPCLLCACLLSPGFPGVGCHWCVIVAPTNTLLLDIGSCDLRSSLPASQATGLSFVLF